jgi:hypothetical protein
MLKAPCSGGAVRLARTLAESYQLGNGRIAHGAADLKFLDGAIASAEGRLNIEKPSH